MDKRDTPPKKPRFCSQGRLVRLVQEPNHVRRIFSFAGVDEKAIALNYVKRGKITCCQAGDDEFIVTAHEFYLFDEAVSTRVVYDAVELIELYLPRGAVLRDSEVLASSSAASRIIGACTLTVMLRGALEALHAVFDDLDETERATSLTAIEMVACTVVREGFSILDGERYTENTRQSSKPHRDDFFTKARDYIEGNLSESGLNSVWIAREIGCSRATLYRVFSEHGLTVANYIRKRRLDRLRFLLVTTPSGGPIGDLAASCGLYDSPNLSRDFRAQYRMTPSEARGLSV